MAHHPFRLPKITYPLSIDTIGKLLVLGHELSIHCETYGCRHSSEVNLVQLGYRIGFDHSCMAADLKRYFYCPKCRDAERPDKKIGFIDHAPTNPAPDWPRKPNAYQEAKGG
jgi:hypothetical protein